MHDSQRGGNKKSTSQQISICSMEINERHIVEQFKSKLLLDDYIIMQYPKHKFKSTIKEPGLNLLRKTLVCFVCLRLTSDAQI